MHFSNGFDDAITNEEKKVCQEAESGDSSSYLLDTKLTFPPMPLYFVLLFSNIFLYDL